MVFRIPGAGRLVKAAQPQYGIGDHLVTELEALEVVFVARDEVFAEDAKLLVSQPENHVGIEPWIILAWVRLAVTRESVGRHEDLEFARRVLVLGERRMTRKRHRQGGDCGAPACSAPSAA